MKKLLFILLCYSIKLSAQLQTCSLLNIYPVDSIPKNYQLQFSNNNNSVVSATFGDSLTAEFQLTWHGAPPTTNSYSYALWIRNYYSPCTFGMTAIPGTNLPFNKLTIIDTSTGIGYFKYNFKLKGFSACSDTNGYKYYELSINAAPVNPNFNSTIPFKVIPLLTGIQEYSFENTTNVFPNPTAGNFIFETSSTENQQLQMFDATGKLLLTQTIQNGKAQIDASSFGQGIYNVYITSNNGITNKRVVILK